MIQSHLLGNSPYVNFDDKKGKNAYETEKKRNLGNLSRYCNGIPVPAGISNFCLAGKS